MLFGKSFWNTLFLSAEKELGDVGVEIGLGSGSAWREKSMWGWAGGMKRVYGLLLDVQGAPYIMKNLLHSMLVFVVP